MRLDVGDFPDPYHSKMHSKTYLVSINLELGLYVFLVLFLAINRALNYEREQNTIQSSTTLAQTLSISVEAPELSAYILKGSNIEQYSLGDELVAYGFQGSNEIPIALLRVYAINRDSLSAQALLKHDDLNLFTSLRVDQNVSQLNSSSLVPGF